VKPTARAPDPALAQRQRVALAGLVIIAMLGASSRIWTQIFDMFGWKTSQGMALSILRLLSLAAGFVAGGMLLRRSSPRRIATLAGVLYGLGTLGAGILLPQSTAGYFVYLLLACLAALGTGLGFVVVTTTVLAWFPDRRGAIAGLALSSLLVSALPGEVLMSYVGIRSLVLLGLLALIGIPLAAWALLPAPAARGMRHPAAPLPVSPPRTAFWALLFLNTLAGALVAGSLLAGMRSMEFTRTRYAFAFAVTMGLGALVLGAFSDRRGRRRVLLAALMAQVLILLTLPLMLAASVPLLLLFMLSSGGGFSITSAILADSVGAAELGTPFGLLLTAWCLAFLATGALSGLAGEGGLPFMLAAALPLVALVITWRLPAHQASS
jgi:OFA family oxalate/formate antiporter-like MFS transporter